MLKWIPIGGVVHLCVSDLPIDAGATVGTILVVTLPGKTALDVKQIAQERGHFGIYAGWNSGLTYVGSKN
jgi:hypothetical protein